jgi:RimJ/RimL family protein N-acetyltransferase
MCLRLDVPVLCGSLIRLEPLALSHAPDLALAAEEDRSSYRFTMVPRADDVTEYLAAQLARAGLTPFAQVRVRDGRAVGCTSFCTPRTFAERPGLQAIEVGWTWLAGSAQGTGINAEAKLLLFSHAFEVLGVARVDLRTDARNERSRRAIANLGAHFEGVLRSSSPSRATGEDGMLRDSAMFSVIAAEWPTVKSALAARVRQAGLAPAAPGRGSPGQKLGRWPTERALTRTGGHRPIWMHLRNGRVGLR